MERFDKRIAFTLSAIALSISAVCHAGEANLSENNFKPTPPPLLLAKDYRSNIELSLYLISEKLDGVRAFWNGENLITRSGRLVNSPSWFTKDFPKSSLDGELWLGRQQFEKLSGIVRRKRPDDNEWRHVRYMVFDMPENLSTFERRYAQLQTLVRQAASRYLTLVSQQSIQSESDLNDHLSTIIAKGGEGLMLHRKDSLYQAKRSFDLQKLKPFDDEEAIVVAHFTGKGKFKDMMGAIEVINKEGIRFKIGSGFSRKERMDPPPINSEITYRYRGKTNKNTPKFATFLRMSSSD